MDATHTALYLLLALVAAAGHGAILRFAVRLMVHVQIPLRTAWTVIAAEYAVALVIGVLARLAWGGGWQLPAALGFTGLLATGAVLVGRQVALADGEPVGVGNGVLIQFMQVPMVIPFLILLSFFIVPPF